MSNLNKFIENVKEGILSVRAPVEEMDDHMAANTDFYLSSFQSREECTKRGMWAIVDLNWTKRLAEWINGRKCLEVMSGAGWLAKALNFHGVDIVATDDFGWQDKQHKEMKVVYSVEKLNGLEAVRMYGNRDILIVSWPPYESDEICSICNEWGNNKPIIYIGEGEGGCCAGESFWKNFKTEEDLPSMALPQWWGIHDYLSFGYWTGSKQKESRKVKNAISEPEVLCDA